jgi:hypothetical protein
MMHTADSLVLAVAAPGKVYSKFNKYYYNDHSSSVVVVVVVVVVVISVSIIDI